MFMLTRRLQILLDEDRYERVERESRRTNRSVAATIRHALDLAYPPDAERRRAALARILAAAPMDVPDVAELKREIEAAHERRL
jgi:GrpB-like predicted nucleotidyltransferase (UPF0157 family)